jgi:large subunit ribosomal protein L17
MCFIELVDYNENLLKEKAVKKTRTRRSRKGSGNTSSNAVETSAVEVVETGEAEASKIE